MIFYVLGYQNNKQNWLAHLSVAGVLTAILNPLTLSLTKVRFATMDFFSVQPTPAALCHYFKTLKPINISIFFKKHFILLVHKHPYDIFGYIYVVHTPRFSHKCQNMWEFPQYRVTGIGFFCMGKSLVLTKDTDHSHLHDKQRSICGCHSSMACHIPTELGNTYKSSPPGETLWTT